MPPDADPAFEVATIKPTDTSAPHGKYIHIEGRHLIAFNMTVRNLLVYAFGLNARQIVDGPPALLDRPYDIDGIPDIDGHPNRNQSRSMFRKLLISRFKLKFHDDSRELPAYVIRVANGGPKLTTTASKPGDAANFTYSCPPVLTVRNYSIADFAKGMQDAFLDRPVVDQTGLKNRYDFVLKWTGDDSQTYCPPGSADSNAPPGLFTAIEEQLGLKLTATKAPISVMVIDHIEVPSEN